jgi:hypothetical protein
MRLEQCLSQELLGEVSEAHRNYVGAIEDIFYCPGRPASGALGTTLAEVFAEVERGSDDADGR